MMPGSTVVPCCSRGTSAMSVLLHQVASTCDVNRFEEGAGGIWIVLLFYGVPNEHSLALVDVVLVGEESVIFFLHRGDVGFQFAVVIVASSKMRNAEHPGTHFAALVHDPFQCLFLFSAHPYIQRAAFFLRKLASPVVNIPGIGFFVFPPSIFPAPFASGVLIPVKFMPFHITFTQRLLRRH